MEDRKYNIIIGTSGTVIDAVNTAMECGWKPLGRPSVTKRTVVSAVDGSTKKIEIYHQCMFKD